MQGFILIGWMTGVLVAFLVGLASLLLFGVPTATILAAVTGTPFAVLMPLITTLAGAFTPIVGLLAPLLAGASLILILLLVLLAILLSYLIFYGLAYVLATASIAPTLPGLTATPGLTFPLATPIPAPAGAILPVLVPPLPGESFARGFMVGFNVVANIIILFLLPLGGLVWTLTLATWTLVVISLTAIIPVARNRVYQGFLGWSAWLFPISYLATFVGLLLFLFNMIASVIDALFRPALRPWTVAIDFTTGVVESTNGFILRLSCFDGGFSLGNFTFLMNTACPPLPALFPSAAFTAPSISSHETGHSLNTAAFGGVVLWLNAIDENLPAIARRNLAYGELTAEGHAAVMPGAAAGFTLTFAARVWV